MPSSIADDGYAVRPSIAVRLRTLTVPKEVLTTVDALLTSSPRLAGAVRQLAVLPGLLEVDVDAMRDAAREQLKESPFAALAPTEQFHADGKVTFRSNDFESHLKRHVAVHVGSHLVLVEATLGYFLRNAVSRLEPSTLLDALASWPHLPPHRATLLGLRPSVSRATISFLPA